MIDYKKHLNTSQYEAVKFDKGPLLVIAGAGSGKTRTLTYRVARLVDEGVPPKSILLLTFTRKASHEMLQRASNLLDDRCENVSGGTFHSFANTMLRRYAGYLGYNSSFTIIDRADMENLIATLKKEMRLGEKDRSFPKKNTMASLFSRSVNKVKPLEDIIYDDYPHFTTHMDALGQLYAAYDTHKNRHNLMDYDDLLVNFHRLLKEFPDIRQEIASTFKFVMVDEYQDTNQIQADIIYLLSGEHGNIMVVGDDSQSIYAFRGAEIRNILSFPDCFPGTTVIRLEENYRSVQPILHLTNQIIDQAAYKYTKTLFSRKKGGSCPCLMRTSDENSQSRFIVDKIRDLSLQGVRLNRIAVLFRAGFHSFDLEIELGREGIPFVKVGGFKFMDSAHIKDVLAHLKVIHNPDDSISWYRILLLLEKVGPKGAAQMFNDLQKKGGGYQGLAQVKLRPALAGSVERLKSLFSVLTPETMTIAALGERIVDYYLPILKKRFDDHPRRERDLEQLLSIMERYGDLEAFLTDMAIEPPSASIEGTFSTGESIDESRLTLSTIHSAKGLEWHTVFIIWTLDGRFPAMRSLHKEDEIEEELRLMYVAATRAEENLFFVCPGQAYDRATGLILNRPSRFLEHIPEDALDIRRYAS
ncbi:MAG: ATP-dependent helicase [Deltaproteobacteria bacterium]|nr:ATP-dependent helicase [Deltaproteobacteria bacterium]